MDSRPSSLWRRTGEVLRWRGFWVLLLLGARNILRPIVYWHVYRIFATDIAAQVPEPYAKEKIETKICTRDCSYLDQALTQVAALGEISREEAQQRLQRGDALAIAYASAEPAGYGWISFASGVVELDFGVTWIVRPGEAVRYGNFVHPKWRGRGIQSSINTAVNEYAREHGVSVTLGSISAMNAQSLSLAKHYNRPTGDESHPHPRAPVPLAYLPRLRRAIQVPLQRPGLAIPPNLYPKHALKTACVSCYRDA
jgi:L-amino acid N-acyltransferase YncA